MRYACRTSSFQALYLALIFSITLSLTDRLGGKEAWRPTRDSKGVTKKLKFSL